MLRLRNGVEADDYDSEKEGDDCHADSDGESMENGLQRRLEDLRRFPFELGDLQIISLGKSLVTQIISQMFEFAGYKMFFTLILFVLICILLTV